MIHVFHHNDLDGKCGAAIIRRYWFAKTPGEMWGNGDMKFIECDYKDSLDDHIEEIEKDDTVVIVDFSFKPEQMNKVKIRLADVYTISHRIYNTDRIYWFDHHKTAFEYDYGFIPKGIRNANLAGCEIVWKFLNPDKAEPLGVILIGDYDIWTHRYGELTEYFNLGLQLYDTDPRSSVWDQYVLKTGAVSIGFDPMLYSEITQVAEAGKTCKAFRDNFTKQYCKDWGFETTFEGYKCFAMGFYEFGSKAFGDLINKYDICLAFEWDGKMWSVGLYTDNPEINVGKLAVEAGKKYGALSAGGHPGAAGMVVPELPFKRIG